MKSLQELADLPPQPGVQAEAAQRTIDRAVERLYQTVGPKMLSKAPSGLDHIVDEQPQPDSPDVPGASWLTSGRRVAAIEPSLIFYLCLASLVIAALIGTGIFFLTHPSENKVAVESVPAEEMPEAVPATDMGLNTALARPASTATSAPVAPKAETNSAVRAPPLAEASTAVVSTLTSPSGNSEKSLTAPLAPTAGASSTTATPRPARPPSEPGFSGEEIAALVARGDASLATGDVASARLFYERAADSGEAQAAVRLGETFDPLFLDRPRLRGVSGDLGMALFWYRRARDLGATEVERRLKTLETKQGG
jgi:hypothetical protein